MGEFRRPDLYERGDMAPRTVEVTPVANKVQAPLKLLARHWSITKRWVDPVIFETLNLDIIRSRDKKRLNIDGGDILRVPRRVALEYPC